MEYKIKTDFDIVVVGGGLVGGVFACDIASRSKGLKIAILEKAPFQFEPLTDYDSRIYAISPQNVEYLQKLGLWSDSDSRIGTIKKMQIYADRDGKLLFHHMDTNKLFLAKTIEYNNLQQKIYAQLKLYDNVSFVTDTLDSITNEEYFVRASGKKNSYSTNLIVGADGVNSFVRKGMESGLSVVDYPQSAIVANFACELPHNNTAYQWFLGNGDILAYLPLSNQQISIVWSTTDHVSLLEQSTLKFSQRVAAAGNNQLGSLEILNQAQAFPLKLQTILKTYSHRQVLIGDAAHTIHPLAGQGLNLGFADSYALATELHNVHALQLGDSAVLSRYAIKRLFSVRQMQLTCHGLFNLFNLEQSACQLIRNKGFNLLNAVSFLKKYLIKSAVSY